MKREFNPSRRQVTITFQVSEAALDLIRKNPGTFELRGGPEDEKVLPLIEELESAGMLESVPQAWHSTWKVTEFGLHAVNRSPPRLSLPLLIHNMIEDENENRRRTADQVYDALTEAGMEVDSVCFRPTTISGERVMLCKALFLDDEGRSAGELTTVVEDCLGLPKGYFPDNAPFSRLTGLRDGETWHMWVCGPSLEG